MGILQLMAPDQAKLVPLLGKTTGWDVQSNKREECASLGNDWVSVAGSEKQMQFDVLPNCASYLQVKLKRVTDGGDHDVAICEVVGTGVWDDNKQTVLWLEESDAGGQSALDPSTALYSGQLRDEGII
jgi:flavin reductase (DIM6/NTAB) family NADH-FMN oxidoreductase RutF